MNSKSIAIVVIALIVGGAAGFWGGRIAGGSVSRADIEEIAEMMNEDGSDMQKMGKQMAEMGRMMQEKGKNDPEMVESGRDAETEGIEMQEKGKDMMEHGEDLRGGMMSDSQ